ncbi:hypothetical protein [Natrarchaeobius oligotrophus]|nr:hypothetical protein [Natrarchaeobius chitinivorans]
MSSGRETAGATGPDAAELVCDRCGDPVPPERVIRLSSEPCSELANRYAAVSRAYCPDCVAGIGMLGFAVETRARSSARSD